MRIDGAGGCFDNRLYEVDIDVAWNIALLCVNEMAVTIDEQDDAAHGDLVDALRTTVEAGPQYLPPAAALQGQAQQGTAGKEVDQEQEQGAAEAQARGPAADDDHVPDGAGAELVENIGSVHACLQM